ncbi:MAG: hypothetical protein JXA96_05780 [Sedimentisphaerales bacterium]|nr:hypothetical protein [Sedimentisphaerales bacterium]
MISISRNNLQIAGVIWGISVVVFASIYMFILKPQKLDMDNYAVKQQKIDTTDFELQKKQLREQIDSIKVNLDDFVIGSDYVQDLASVEIFNLAKDNNLDSFLIRPWRDKEVPAFKNNKYVYGQFIQVSFNATFNEFAQFLNKLERHEPYIFIDSFSIKRSTDGNKKHEVDMDLAILVEKNKTSKGAKG